MQSREERRKPKHGLRNYAQRKQKNGLRNYAQRKLKHGFHNFDANRHESTRTPERELSLRGHVENQVQRALVCELTLRVNGHSNGQESPLCHHYVF